ncbi:hypothetical protein DRQ25_12415 [Candidatus Fermentibacteria bacterium]|nr:MAG: hypothetical protein DRQ25_12415 [Candidatus Fermentibacteria bacterium]
MLTDEEVIRGMYEREVYIGYSIPEWDGLRVATYDNKIQRWYNKSDLTLEQKKALWEIVGQYSPSHNSVIMKSKLEQKDYEKFKDTFYHEILHYLDGRNMLPQRAEVFNLTFTNYDYLNYRAIDRYQKLYVKHYHNLSEVAKGTLDFSQRIDFYREDGVSFDKEVVVRVLAYCMPPSNVSRSYCDEFEFPQSYQDNFDRFMEDNNRAYVNTFILNTTSPVRVFE